MQITDARRNKTVSSRWLLTVDSMILTLHGVSLQTPSRAWMALVRHYLVTAELHMGQIVNLRTARKRAKRRQAEQEAARNRLAHGRPKAERTLQRSRERQSPEKSRPTPDRNGRRAMKSPVIKRSIVIAGHKTSVSLEDAFWKGLKDIAVSRHMTLSDLVASIDSGTPARQSVIGHPAVRARSLSGAPDSHGTVATVTAITAKAPNRAAGQWCWRPRRTRRCCGPNSGRTTQTQSAREKVGASGSGPAGRRRVWLRRDRVSPCSWLCARAPAVGSA